MSILVHPDDRLRETSKQIEYVDGQFDLNGLVESMVMAMRKHPTSVGLSAVQIGFAVRMFLMIQDPKKRMPEIIINPSIVSFKGEPTLLSEGCLSFPGVYEQVLRYPTVNVKYDTLEWPNTAPKTVEKTLEAFPAQIFQHEFDHLDGKLMIDRLSPRDAKRITNKMKKWKMKGYIY